MQKHLEEVLTAMGLPADQVKVLVQTPDNAPDFKTDAFVAPVRANVETAVKNDPKFYETLDRKNLPVAFVKAFEQEQYGRAANIVRTNILKAVGLTDKDFDELGEDGKKLELFAPAFAKKLAEGKVTDKELQNKLIEANKTIETLQGDVPNLEKKYQDQYAAKLSEYEVQNGVLSSLATVQGLTVQPKYLLPTLMATLRSKYAFEVVDGAVELRQKDKPTLKVLVNNGTKELTLKDAVTTILTDDNLIDLKKKTTIEHGKPIVVEHGEGGGLKISKHVNDKIAARLKEEEKEAK